MTLFKNLQMIGIRNLFYIQITDIAHFVNVVQYYDFKMKYQCCPHIETSQLICTAESIDWFLY